MQLELFPNYPRLTPVATPPLPVYDLTEDWKAFDYPFEEESMGQSSTQADMITYLKGVIEAALNSRQSDYFVGNDVFVYYTTHEHTDTKGKPLPKQHQLAPDIFVATGVKMQERKSFIKENELPLIKEGVFLRMIAFEVLSDSNYLDKKDAQKRYVFYNGLGVEEYIIIHTQPSLSLEVFWRINGRLERTLFYHNYRISLLDISLELEPVPATDDEPATTKLYAVASDGSRFENYGTEREIRLQAQKKLSEVQKNLTEYTKKYFESQKYAEEQARIAEAEAQARAEAEKNAQEQARIAKEQAKRTEQEKQARLEAEAHAQALAFELEELRNLLNVQKQYEK